MEELCNIRKNADSNKRWNMLTLQKNYWLKLGHKGGVTQSSEKKC